MRRDNEALATLQQLDTLAQDNDKIIPYHMAGLVVTLFTTVHAAAANLKGLLLYSKGKREEAMAAFKQALVFDSTYQLPQLNLASLLVPSK